MSKDPHEPRFCLPLATVLSGWSTSEGTGWSTEFERLQQTDAAWLNALTEDIADRGIVDPIALGTDGRVWKGHRRLLVAHELGIEQVPVTFAGAGAPPPPVQPGAEEIITTREELAKVPIGHVYQSARGTIACRYSRDEGLVFGDESPIAWAVLDLPAQRLWPR